MIQRRPLVAANWKMNGDASLAELMKLSFEHFANSDVDTVICPPATLIGQLTSIDAVAIGAQDMSSHQAGAYTGEVSGQMLVDAGVSYVIVGHSERRQYHQESDELVGNKIIRALEHQLTPIFCIGESLETREQGQLFEFLRNQLEVVIRLVGIENFSRVVIAYEPIWAIGTGVTATSEQAQQVHEFVRNVLAEHDADVAQACRIVYGGSVNPENAEELFAQEDIDGGLVGGASLKPDSFIAICAAAAG